MSNLDYNQISQIYDDVRQADVELINAFLRELPPADQLSVLDLGCGTANHTDLFQRLTGAQVCGVEPSAGMLDKARQKNPHIIFKQGASDAIPFPAARFDFAFMTDVIHHVPDLRAMFRELWRVLRPEGKLCIVTQSHWQIGRRPIVQFFPGTARVDQARYPDIDVIVAAGQEGGLAVLQVEALFVGEPVELGASYLELARKKGYSMLHLLTDEEYQQGLQALETALSDGPIIAQQSGVTLVWFQKL